MSAAAKHIMSREVDLTVPDIATGVGTVDSDVTSNSGPTGAPASSDVDLSQLRKDGNQSIGMESASGAETINADDFDEEEDEDIEAEVIKKDKFYQSSVQRLMTEIDQINGQITKMEKNERGDSDAIREVKKLKREKEERRRLLDLAMNEQQKALEKEELRREQEEKQSVLDFDSNTRIHRSGRTFFTGNNENNNNNRNSPISGPIAHQKQKTKQKQKEKEKTKQKVRESSRTVGNLLRAVNTQPHKNLGGDIAAECKESIGICGKEGVAATNRSKMLVLVILEMV